MKITILTFALAALLLGQDKEIKPAKGATTNDAAKTNISLPAGVPRGATQVGPNLYRFLDAQGKVWFYRQSPFGISKWEEKEEVQRIVAAPPTTIRDLGDRIEFQRQTPFGTSKWTTKKTDLTAEEKQLLAADEASRAGTAKDGAGAQKTYSEGTNKEKQEKE
jgi:hypothetical protein